MKTKFKILMLLLLFGISLSAQDENKKEIIHVDGNCQMCQKRIQKAALKVKGVKYANWEVESNQLTLIYNQEKCDLETIQIAIADAGHDNTKYKAKEVNYQNLPPCCLYRDPETKKMKHH